MADTAESSAAQLGTRAVSNSVLILAARVVSRAISLVVVIVLANSLGATQYGEYTTLVVYSAIISVVADLGFAPLYTREAARNRNQLGDYLGTLLILKLALSFSAIVVFAILFGLGTRLTSLIIPGAVLLIATAYANQLRNTFYAVGRAEFDAIALLGEIAIQAGLILFGARQHAGVSYFVLAYASSYLFTVVYSLVVIRVFRLGEVRIRFDRTLVMRWWPLALPFALTSFLTNLYFDADRVILPIFRPFAEVGWYNLAYKPYEALQFVPLAIQVVVYPLLGVYFVMDVTRLRTAYMRFFKALVLLGWPLTVGTFVLVHNINALFNRSGAFAQSESALRILAFGIVFLFASSSFYAMLNATNRQQFNAVATGIAAAINIVLNFIFIPFYGYLAASATTVVTEAALCSLGWWFVQRGRPDLRLPVLAVSWRILLAGAVMGAVLYPLRGESILLSVPAGFLVYVVAVLVIRAVDPEEWDMLMEGLLARLRRNPPRVIVVGRDGKA